MKMGGLVLRSNEILVFHLFFMFPYFNLEWLYWYTVLVVCYICCADVSNKKSQPFGWLLSM